MTTNRRLTTIKLRIMTIEARNRCEMMGHRLARCFANAAVTEAGLVLLPVYLGGGLRDIYECDLREGGWLDHLRGKRWFTHDQERDFISCVNFLNRSGKRYITMDFLLRYD